MDEKIAILDSYFKRPTNESVDDYSSWLISEYGEYFYENYSKIYTEKYWGLGAKYLSTEWIRNRIRKSDEIEILRGALQDGSNHYYYVNEMRYPLRGGYGAFLGGLLDNSKILTNKRISIIHPNRKSVICEDGSEYKYKTLISSIPLPTLVPLVENLKSDFVEKAELLLWTRVDLTSYSLPGNWSEKLWFYIYDKDILPARAYSPSVKSKHNAPEGFYSLQFETYTLNTKEGRSKIELDASCREALRRLRFPNSPQARLLDQRTLPFGNIVFFHGMEEIRDKIRVELKSLGVNTIGRFGEWDYLWSNQSFMSGYSQVMNLYT
jgi:protoporphyrinogen oxidase